MFAHPKMKVFTTRLLIAALIVAVIASYHPMEAPFASQAIAAADNNRAAKPALTESTEPFEPFYFERLEEWKSEGVPNGTRGIYIPAVSLTGQSDDAAVEIGSYKGKNETLIWFSQRGWVEFKADVPEAGLYELVLEYHPKPWAEGAGRRAVQFSAQINGEHPFREAKFLEFNRQFQDQFPLRTDAEGNHIRPVMKEIEGWQEKPFTDSEGSYTMPLLWNLNKGENTIRLTLQNESVAIAGIRLRPPTELISYEEAKRSYPQAANQGEHLIVIEAEQMAAKNETAIQLEYNRDALSTPSAFDRIVYNAVGGTRWQMKAQKAVWEFEVPEDGYYYVVLRGYQGYAKSLSSYRTLYVNGEIPFQEVQNVRFPYDNKFASYEIADRDGEPFMFYLKKGKNSIALQNTHNPYIPVIAKADELSGQIRALARKLREATGGGKVDKFRNWDVETELPGFTDELKMIQEELVALSKVMEEANGGVRSDVSRAFEAAAKDIGRLLRKPNEIPNKELNIGSLQESIEAQRNTLLNKPLLLEKIYIASAGQKMPRLNATVWERTKAAVQSFYYSFNDRDTLSNMEDDVLNVWFMFGRDYVNELQNLANEYFTPEYGIKVRVNLIQQPELLIMANAAGIMPDVALGVPGDMPFDMALRGAALDLSELPGAKELAERYHPGSLLPFYYNGGLYGIPETLRFKVLFYRKDILDRLGLEIPDTWNDVYKMIPTLLQNNYNFYMEPKDFSILFYQHGVDLYSADGLRTGLNSAEAFTTFKEWTDLFNIFGLDRNIQSFYNHFRRGYLPVGIADFNQYMQLLVAAPEIRGTWGIAPIPGVEQADGTVVRWASGIPDGTAGTNVTGSSMTAMMLFDNEDEEKKRLAWEFAKWYSSTEIQTEFGTNLENFFGEQFRWNSANVEAFSNMPWKNEDLEVILEQWKWFKDFPVVPGAYMTGRELNNAWLRTVVDGMNDRESLERAIVDINRELRRKQMEFELIDQEGGKRKPLEMMEVKEPWTGVDEYVR
ncbi:extracellular solute-binding protein [Paenibacillus tarimensis]